MSVELGGAELRGLRRRARGGLVIFAGVLLLTLGTINVIEGISAIGNARFYLGNAHYVFADSRRGVGSF